VPERSLRLGFAVVLVLSGTKILDLPHGDTVVAAGIGLVALAGSSWAVRRYVVRPTPALGKR